MKKIITMAAAIVFAAAPAMAQDTDYTPKKGDWMVGVDVVPLFKTIGGSFSSHEAVPVGGNAFDAQSPYVTPNVAILGKYMLTDKWGLKMNLGVQVSSKNNNYYVQDDLGTFLAPNSGAKVEDRNTVTNTGVSLKFGGEYRIGQKRVQGIVGMGVLFGVGSYNSSYSYGNAITELNRQPSNSFGNVTGQYPQIPSGYRITGANRQGAICNAGIYGSIGAEWMMTRQISLGAEVSLALIGTFGGKAYVKSEGYNEAYNRVEERTDLIGPGNTGIDFGTQNIGTSLYVGFYF